METTNQGEYMTRKQVAEMLSVSYNQVRIFEKQGMPSIPLGHKTVRFNREAVREWVNRKAAEIVHARETLKV